MPGDVIAVRMIAAGHVQGVGFRALVQSICQTHEVTGWVRNREDGSVEAELIGPKPRVDAAVERIRSARAHQIRQLNVAPIPIPPNGLADFEIRW